MLHSPTSRRAPLFVILCFAATALSPTDASAKKGDLTIGLGPNIYVDDATITGTERRSAQVTELDFDIFNDTLFAGEIWLATEVIDNLRLGGGIKYLGPYEYIRKEDAEEEDDPEITRIGQLLELTLRLEYLLELVDLDDGMALDLLLGLDLGMTMLFPDGALEREIADLKDQNVDAWETPRLGYVVGPQVGLRFKYNETLAFRFNVAFNWSQMFLFAIDEKVDGIDFELSRQVDIIRVHVGLGLEATF